jgi:flagellar basal-body rod modification protein FlgD
MQNVNSTLQSTMMLNQSLNNMLTTELIGKSVKALGDGLYLPTSGEVDVEYSLSQDAADVKIQILTREGVAVRTLELGAQPSGEQVVRWDGRDATGTSLDSGVYTYVLQAVDRNGQEVPAATYSTGNVTGIRYTGEGGGLVLIGDLGIPIGNVAEVTR